MVVVGEDGRGERVATWVFQLGLVPNSFVCVADDIDRLTEATPKTVMRVMGVRGLTLYHLKSHLQVRGRLFLLVKLYSSLNI